MRLREGLFGEGIWEGLFVLCLKSQAVAEPRKKQTFFTFIHFYVQIILTSLVVLHSESGGCFKNFWTFLSRKLGGRSDLDPIMFWSGGGGTTATFQSPSKKLYNAISENPINFMVESSSQLLVPPKGVRAIQAHVSCNTFLSSSQNHHFVISRYISWSLVNALCLRLPDRPHLCIAYITYSG